MNDDEKKAAVLAAIDRWFGDVFASNPDLPTHVYNRASAQRDALKDRVGAILDGAPAGE